MVVISRPRRRSTRSISNRGGRSALLVTCLAMIALMGTTGCASASKSSGSSSSIGSAPRASRGAPNIITADEISKTNVQNAYEAIQKLRPTMLRPTQISTVNAQASGELVVYVDNNRYGDISSLRQITAGSIATVRYFSSSEAQTRWGSGHPSGAIEVTTKR